MGKPVNIASTSHAQQAEMAALLGGRGMAVADTNGELIEANARIEALESELAAEREAHAKTQAALTAATSASGE